MSARIGLVLINRGPGGAYVVSGRAGWTGAELRNVLVDDLDTAVDVAERMAGTSPGVRIVNRAVEEEED